MQDYVRYSSQKLKENFDNYKQLIDPVAQKFKAKNYQSIILIASGSSFNALAMIVDTWHDLLKMPIYLQTPESVLGYELDVEQGSFVIVVSQSGSSTNIISCLHYLQQQKISFIALTGNINSEMAKFTKQIYDYGPGNEYVDYVTTGVQTLVEFFLFLGYEICECRNEQKIVFAQQLKEVINNQAEFLNNVDKFIAANRLALSVASPTFFCGNGPNYGVAREGALKFQETLKRPSMFYELEEFLHGPDMQLTPNYTIFLLDDMGTSYQSRFKQVYNALREICTNVFLITSNEGMEKDAHVLTTQTISNWHLSPYYTLPALQLIAAEMADNLKTWETHPYFEKFDKKIAIKTDDYAENISTIKQKWDLENKRINS